MHNMGLRELYLDKRDLTGRLKSLTNDPVSLSNMAANRHEMLNKLLNAIVPEVDILEVGYTEATEKALKKLESIKV